MLFLQNELAQSKPGDSEWYTVEGVWPSLMLNKFWDCGLERGLSMMEVNCETCNLSPEISSFV